MSSAAPAPPPPQPESPSAGAGGAGGGDKVLAAAQHIVKSLATSKNAADDMIRILSGFDNRLSSITNDHLFPSPDPSGSGSSSVSASGSSASEISAAAAFDAADQLIQLWDATPEALVFEAPEDDVAQYLAAVDVAVEHLARGGPGGARAGVAVQLAMARLEEERRHLMVHHDVPTDPTGLFFSLRRPASRAPAVSAGHRATPPTWRGSGGGAQDGLGSSGQGRWDPAGGRL